MTKSDKDFLEKIYAAPVLEFCKPENWNRIMRIMKSVEAENERLKKEVKELNDLLNDPEELGEYIAGM